jgi:hypothetical protein
MEVYDAGDEDHTELVVSACPIKTMYVLLEADTSQCSYLRSHPDVAIGVNSHVCLADLSVFLAAVY